jgi:formylmethanofuran dehydrogenase subunit E
MDYVPDYTDLYEEHERDQERRLKKYPKCDCCDEPITDDYFYDIDGTYFCERCLKAEYRKKTEDYMED